MRQKSEKPMSKRERRRLVRLSVSGILLVLVVAVKLLMPDLANAYKDKLLNLMGEDTDIVEAFSAMGKAFSKEGGIRDTLEDAYTAVFGEKKPEEAASPAQTAAAFSGVYTPESLPEQTALDQRVLGFAYAPPLEGTGIRAFADGVVGVVAQSSDLGNYVTVDHPGGFTTLYAHCKCITASAGQTVRCGAILAQVGQTGAATGPHLHFELHWDQVYINPVYYVAS